MWKDRLGKKRERSSTVDFFSFVFFLFSGLLTLAQISELKKRANSQKKAADWSWNVLFLFFSTAAENLFMKTKEVYLDW